MSPRALVRHPTLWCTTASLLAWSSAVDAQAPATKPVASPQSSRTTTYDAAFFSQYAPRTALDIVQRIPGFTLDLGANNNNNGNGPVDIRGFAGVAATW